MRLGRRVRWLAAALALAGAGVLAAVASGPGFGAINLPTLPTVTVSTPVATTTVTLPSPPPTPPPPPPPVSVPGVTPPPPAPSPPPAGSPAPSSSGSSGSVRQPAGAARSSAAGSRSSGSRTARARRTPARVALGAKKKSVTFVFELPARSRVVFFLRRVHCGTIGSFRVRGHAGVNRIRFRGRLHGHRLAPGVYRVRAKSHGETVLRTRLVVHGPRRACLVAGGGAADGFGTSVGIAAIGGSPKQPGVSGSGKSASGPLTPPTGGNHHGGGGILGVRATKVIPGSGETQVALLIVLLAAISLLAVGAVPRHVVPHPAAAAFVAQRRTIFAAAGLAALGAFLVAYFIA